MPNRCRKSGLFRCFAIGIAALLWLSGHLSLRAEERAAPNDFFSAALQLPGNFRSFSRGIQLSESTAEPGEPLYNGQVVYNSVWLRWTPTYSGMILGSAVTGLFDPVKMDVFEGSKLKSLFPLAANRVGPLVGRETLVAFRVLAGRTYYIRLQDRRTPWPPFTRFAGVSLRLIRNIPEERQVALRSSFSVHPALLSPSARSLYDKFWLSRPVVTLQDILGNEGHIGGASNAGMNSIGGVRR